MVLTWLLIIWVEELLLWLGPETSRKPSKPGASKEAGLALRVYTSLKRSPTATLEGAETDRTGSEALSGPAIHKRARNKGSIARYLMVFTMLFRFDGFVRGILPV